MTYVRQDMNDLTGWQRIPCKVADLLHTDVLTVAAGFTDLDGTFGRPVIYREWALQGTPVLREYRWPQESVGDRDCEHYVPEVAV